MSTVPDEKSEGLAGLPWTESLMDLLRWGVPTWNGVGAQAKEKKSPRLTPSEVRFSYQKEKDSVGDGRWDFFFKWLA